MTAQEAIEWIKAISAVQKESIHKNSLLQRKEALHMAIEALEKQIPKKPDYEADGYDENGNLIYDYAKCPICGHDFEYDINDWGCNYCSDCGQKLDWSE